MNRARTILLGAGLTALACVAYGADGGVTSLLPADSAVAFKLSSNAGEFAKMSTTPVTGRPFKSALRIEVAKKPQRAGDVMISAPRGCRSGQRRPPAGFVLDALGHGRGSDSRCGIPERPGSHASSRKHRGRAEQQERQERREARQEEDGACSAANRR